jgi:hypothetical protein
MDLTQPVLDTKTNAHQDMDNPLPECRVCSGSDSALGGGPGELIYPCSCNQPRHRKCLDDWRVVGPKGAFYRCEVCNWAFVFLPPPQLSKTATCCRRCKLVAFVARDSLAVFAVLQATIVLFGYIVSVIDKTRWIPNWLPSALLFNFGEWAIYYSCGAVITLFLLGIVGSIMKASDCFPGDDPLAKVSGEARPLVRSSTGTGGGCNCDSCNCNGCSGEGVGFILILLAVVAVVICVVLVAVGLFFLIVFGTWFFQKSLQNHFKKVWLRDETKLRPVLDYTRHHLPVLPSAPAAPVESSSLESIGF